MALGQYNVFIIPEIALKQRYGCIPEAVETDSDEFDYNWWEVLNVTLDSLLPILEAFGPQQEWTKKWHDYKSFGEAAKHDISISCNASGVVNDLIHVRIMVHALTDEVANLLCNFAALYNCLLVDNSGHVFKPEIPALLRSIKHSTPSYFKYLPENFLRDYILE